MINFELSSFRPRQAHFEDLVENLKDEDHISINRDGAPVAVVITAEHYLYLKTVLEEAE